MVAPREEEARGAALSTRETPLGSKVCVVWGFEKGHAKFFRRLPLADRCFNFTRVYFALKSVIGRGTGVFAKKSTLW